MSDDKSPIVFFAITRTLQRSRVTAPALCSGLLLPTCCAHAPPPLPTRSHCYSDSSLETLAWQGLAAPYWAQRVHTAHVQPRTRFKTLRSTRDCLCVPQRGNTWTALWLIMAALHCEEPPLRSGLLILRPHG
ncbi:hypothetical protein MHYP_G00267560 [Metynnis hypsauchen]